MQFLLDNQASAILICFFTGSVIAIFLYQSNRGSTSWKVADLIWVALGGLGALTAIISNSYQSEQSRINRQIDVAYSLSQTFEQTSGRFRLLHCEKDRQGPMFRPSTLVLCNKVEFLAASNAINRDLALFVEVTNTTATLKSLRWLFGDSSGQVQGVPMSSDEMMAAANAFNPRELLTFVAMDDETKAALATLQAGPRSADIAAEYQVLATAYETLIDQLERLKVEWDYLQANSVVLLLQLFAVCCIAFAAPFRLGKSFNDF